MNGIIFKGQFNPRKITGLYPEDMILKLCETHGIQHEEYARTGSWTFADMEDNRIKPVVYFGYAYDAIGDAVQLTAAFAGGGGVFNTEGAEPERSKINAGMGVVFMDSSMWDVSINYDYEYKSHYAAHGAIWRMSTKF